MRLSVRSWVIEGDQVTVRTALSEEAAHRAETESQRR